MSTTLAAFAMLAGAAETAREIFVVLDSVFDSIFFV